MDDADFELNFEESPELDLDLGEVINIGGAVNSVNGKTGDVVLTTSDIQNTSGYQTASQVTQSINSAVAVETENRQISDNGLQTQIDAITASSDVTDIVGTYAALEAYDTTHLNDNDIIKVLQDENQNDETTYYRWNKHTETFSLIGEEGPYYTKAQADELFNAKQDKLTAGANITINADDEISATDTTYTAGANVSISADNEISATDTTYSNFVGTDGQTAGTAGLVPAPATTDADKFLKSDGTWATAGGSGPTVVQTTGTSQTDVMSQNATTSMIYGDPGTEKRIKIGDNRTETGGNYTVAIGTEAKAKKNYTTAIGDGAVANAINCLAIGSNSKAGNSTTQYRAIAIGQNSQANNLGAIAIGAYSTASSTGEINVGTSETAVGYNSSNYRLISGVHDGQNAHDAVTVGQVNTTIDAINTALGTSIPHIGA